MFKSPWQKLTNCSRRQTQMTQFTDTNDSTNQFSQNLFFLTNHEIHDRVDWRLREDWNIGTSAIIFYNLFAESFLIQSCGDSEKSALFLSLTYSGFLGKFKKRKPRERKLEWEKLPNSKLNYRFRWSENKIHVQVVWTVQLVYIFK